MRILSLLMLFLLTSFNIASQNLIRLDEPVYKQILQEFKVETRRRGIFIDHYISQDLGGIHTLTVDEMVGMDRRKNPKYPAAGITYRVSLVDDLGFWHSVPMIGIREDMLNYDYRLIKAIVFHELGHFFGLGHINNIGQFGMHIMTPLITSDYYKTDIPKESMEDYYNQLRTVKRSKRWHITSNNR